MTLDLRTDIELSSETFSQIDEGVDFVASYTGVHTPAEVTLFVSTNAEFLFDNYRALAGGTLHDEARAALDRPAGGVAIGGKFFVNPSVDTELLDNPGVSSLVTHEFYHCVQGFMTGKPMFSSADYPAWMIEGTAQLMTIYNNPYQPREMDEIGEMELFDLGGPFEGLQTWESFSGDFGTIDGTYIISAALISLYTKERGLTDQAWTVDLWLNIGANNQDWRAAWQQTYGAPIEEFYAWADTTFNTYNTFHS